MNGVVLGLAAALCIAAANFTGGVASRRDSSLTVAFLAQVLPLPLLAFAFLVVPPSEVTWTDLAYGAAAGLTQISALTILWRALAAGSIGLLVTINAVLAAGVPTVWALLTGEALGMAAAGGAALAVVAPVLVTRVNAEEVETVAAHKARALQALLAGSLLGLGFVLLALPAREASIAPLIAMRVTAAAVAAGLLLRSVGARWWPSPGNRMTAALPGFFGVASLLLFVAAAHQSVVATVSVVQALAPALTAVLALALLGQRMERRQVAGLMLATCAVALLAAG